MFKFYLDLLENKTFGIFQLLDDECKLRQPSLTNFVHTVKATHKNKLIPNRAKNELNSFTIRHFAQDVQYCCVRILKISNHIHFLSFHIFIQNGHLFQENFIENNTEKCSGIILCSLTQSFSLLWPVSEVESSESISTPANTGVTKKTTSSKFRTDLNFLLTRLNSTVSKA